MSSFPPIPYATWRARVEAELGAEAERRLRRETLEGIAVEPLYAADDLADAIRARADASSALPLPRSATTGAGWRIWQEVPLSGGAAARAALDREADRGLGGVWLCVDSDEVTAQDLAVVAGPSLARSGVELVLEGASSPLAGAALLVAGARLRGVPVETLRGCLGGDPLGELARRGSLPYASPSEELVAAARWTRERAPSLSAALVSTAPYVDAGGDAVQEVAFALATGAEVLRWLLDAGFAAEEAAAQVWVSASAGRDLYLQLAKLRALRLTWSMLLAGIDAPVSGLRLHARAAPRTKSVDEPGTDLVRATIETLAAVLAGCSDVTCAPTIHVEAELALGLPLGSATQLLLRDETGLDAIADPAGGSWYVESLTAELARCAWELFQGIERRGGMARELLVGGIASAVAQASERRRRALAAGELPIVGVTIHRPERPVPLPHRPLVVEEVTAHGPSAAAAASAAATSTATAPDPLDALVERALAGATLDLLQAVAIADVTPLRAPPLHPWRDAEAVEENTR